MTPTPPNSPIISNISQMLLGSSPVSHIVLGSPRSQQHIYIMTPPPYPASKIPQQPEQAAGGNPNGGNIPVWGVPDDEDTSDNEEDTSDHGS